MKHLLKTILFLLLCLPLYGQDSLLTYPKTLGIEYFGELAFHPGVRIDLGIPIWTNTKLKGKKNRTFLQQLLLRPKIGYYVLPKYTNNFFVGTDLSLNFRTTNKKKRKYLFFESFIGLGYLRYSYIGTIYESTASGGFAERKFGGGNSSIVSTGFLIGGSLPAKKLEWILGIEYFLELSEDKLIIQHPTARFGVRAKLEK
ncbi:MAG: hypothetical protein ACI8VT_003654 [Saprospiraceae bacterium]|jgi:hypothetical protein